MENTKKQSNIIVRIFSIFKRKRARNILYFSLIIFAIISMFLIDQENVIRRDYLPFLDNNIMVDIMAFFGVKRYDVTSQSWVIFIIMTILALTILIGNIVAPKFAAKKIAENPDLFSSERTGKIFYSILFYGVLVIIAAVITLIAYIAGAFKLYDSNELGAYDVFGDLLKMLGMYFTILIAIFIIVILIYFIIKVLFMALTGQFRQRRVASKKAQVEEIATAEPVDEEPVNETAQEQTPSQAEVVAAPAPKLEIADIKRKVIQKSFKGKMSQATKEQKEYYNQIKNALLSYARVNSRISWHFDSFNAGRNKLAKIAFRGKTLVMFFALNPKKYENTKYYPRDMKKSKKFADTPMMVKVKSARGAKFAIELIDIVCKDLTKKANFVPETYKFTKMSDKTLIEKGLAKVAYVEI